MPHYLDHWAVSHTTSECSEFAQPQLTVLAAPYTGLVVCADCEGLGRPIPDQSRYGTATTDPLGRDGPGWHLDKNSRLPVRDKETPT